MKNSMERIIISNASDSMDWNKIKFFKITFFVRETTFIKAKIFSLSQYLEAQTHLYYGRRHKGS